jgi:hypothetical protein
MRCRGVLMKSTARLGKDRWNHISSGLLTATKVGTSLALGRYRNDELQRGRLFSFYVSSREEKSASRARSLSKPIPVDPSLQLLRRNFSQHLSPIPINSFKMIDTADPELERSQIRSKIQCHRSIRARVLSCYKAVKHQPVSLSSIQLNQALHSPELLCGLAN